jgi:four helix bundle protein
MLKNYSDLKVWQKAYKLCIFIYKLTRNFPKEELYCLTSQIRRAAVSIPSNIAEGYGRGAIKEYIRFLYIAYGSYCELETQLLLCYDLGYVAKEQKREILEHAKEIERMLKALIKSLEKKDSIP